MSTGVAAALNACSLSQRRKNTVRNFARWLALILLALSLPRVTSADDAPAQKEQPPAFVKRAVVFVCDVPDSKTAKFEKVAAELKGAITSLQVIQPFNVIFMRAEGCEQFDKNLVLATPQNKQKVQDFVTKFKPNGTTDPIPAIEAALAMKPHYIYLLGGHDFKDGPALIARIHEMNKSKTRINTIAFVGNNDENADLQRTLKQIAMENDGVYKFVKENDLKP